MTNEMLEKIIDDTMAMLAKKMKVVAKTKSVEDLIDNNLADIMKCPACYGFEVLDCKDNKCTDCWCHALESEKIKLNGGLL